MVTIGNSNSAGIHNPTWHNVFMPLELVKWDKKIYLNLYEHNYGNVTFTLMYVQVIMQYNENGNLQSSYRMLTAGILHSIYFHPNLGLKLKSCQQPYNFYLQMKVITQLQKDSQDIQEVAYKLQIVLMVSYDFLIMIQYGQYTHMDLDQPILMDILLLSSMMEEQSTIASKLTSKNLKNNRFSGLIPMKLVGFSASKY